MNTTGIDPGSNSSERIVSFRREEILLIDVRTQEEYVGFHLPGAINIPYDEVELSLEMIIRAGKPVVVYSSRGRRSRIAAGRLQTYGLSVFDAGTREAAAAWLQKGAKA